jgi:formylglycine-generating enzyme required for sulfatase activity
MCILALLFAVAGPGQGLIAAETVAPAKTEKTDEWNKTLAAQFDRGAKVAVLIGVGKYAPPNKPLPGAPKSVEMLKDVLIAHGGFTREHITTLTDEQATLANVQQAILLLTHAQPGDTVLVSFNGHGGEGEDGSFLCLTDGHYSTTELRAMLGKSKASQKILLLDSCHAGDGTLALGGDNASGEELAKGFQTTNGLITLAACRKSQISLGTAMGGLFTIEFVRGLAGEADYDKNGIVDSDEIYRYLLLEITAAVSMMAPKVKQMPVRVIGGDVVGVFALSRPDGKTPPFAFDIPPRPKPGDIVTNSIGMKMACLPTSLITLGSPKTEYLRNDDEAEFEVLITRPIWMGTHEVTQAEYEKVMGKNPSYYSRKGDGSDVVAGQETGNFPVEQVSWRDAVEYCEKLSAMPEERQARRAYRLPTEAEWELACRAGTKTVFNSGDRLSPKQANIRGDRPYLDSETGPSLGRTTSVGSYKPNAYGLFDMHGNVAEWCSDYYDRTWFASSAVTLTEADLSAIDEKWKHKGKHDKEYLKFVNDPAGPAKGDSRVYRGGAFTGDVALCRSAARRNKDEQYTYRGIGFRVVCYPFVPKDPE